MNKTKFYWMIIAGLSFLAVILPVDYFRPIFVSDEIQDQFREKGIDLVERA